MPVDEVKSKRSASQPTATAVDTAAADEVAKWHASRLEDLERERTIKMAGSAHAYVRGNTAQFYDWLKTCDSAVPDGPPVWICGDCHVGNLGPLADADGNVDIQIRDLDQTVIGNPAHDLIRLGLSLTTAARGSDLPGVTTARMLEEMITGYCLALKAPDDETPVPEPGAVSSVRRRALGRRWRHLARERIEDATPTIPLGAKFWALSKEERSGIDALFVEPAIRQLVLSLNLRADDSSLEVVDAAYWKKGCSSLGKLRYAVLVEIAAKKRNGKIALIDIKEAVATAAPAARRAKVFDHHGERVVTGARALAPNLGERMIAATLLGRPVVVRELMPQDLKIEIDQFSRDEAITAARYLAYVVGCAHARQMNDATRARWSGMLTRDRTTELDAPHWLWSTVVKLASRHEEGYLEHCRRYALNEAA